MTTTRENETMYNIMYKPHNSDEPLLYESNIPESVIDDKLNHYHSIYAHLSPRAPLKNNAEMYGEEI